MDRRVTPNAAAVPAALDARTRVEAMTRDGDFSWVADLLIQQRDGILDRWLEAAAAQPFHAGRRERAVADHIPALVDALITLLRRTASPTLDAGASVHEPAVLATAEDHARARMAQGLAASDVVTEFRLLRQELGRALRFHVAEAAPTSDVLGAEMLLHDALDDAAFLAVLAIDEHEAELRRLREALATERTTGEQEREAFLNAITHDLRSPLTVIKGTAAVLQREAARGTIPKQRLIERLRRIDDAAIRLDGQLTELQDIARLRTGQALELQRRVVDLVALVQDGAARHQASSEDHEISVILTGLAEPELLGEWDEARLNRVLDNLLGNALKFSPRGGRITLTLARELGQADTPTTAVARMAVLRVSDEGIGIPADELPHVFDWFRRASNAAGKIAGTGIGLAAARQIAELHGGTIGAESQEGSGSTFTLRLPLVATT